MLHSLARYGDFVYSLQGQHPAIESSTLVLIPRGPSMAVLQGELRFRDRIRLRVLERIDFEQKLIEYYSYTVYRGEERLYWYDPQPHPDDATLASTHPHHKHVPPDIKHNRVPAPGLSFEQPNLPVIIKEIEATLLPQSEAPPAASG